MLSRLSLRLAAVLVLLAAPFLGVSLSTTANAAGCPKPLPAAATAKADAVFTGVVTASAPQADGSILNTVSADRVYKGTLAATSVQVTTGDGPCGLGMLPVGQRFVAMVLIKDGVLSAAGNSGTSPATPDLVARVESLLGAGQAVAEVPVAPAEVAFTKVGDSSPTPLLRAAAPGIALALASVCGLLVARRRTAQR